MNAIAVTLKLDMREESTVGVKIAVLLSFNSSLNFVETFNIPVPHMIEKAIEVVKFIPQEQVQSRIMEKIIDTPVLQIQETDEVPWTQFIYKAVDVPVIVRRQVPIIRKVQKTAQVSRAQLIDKVMDVPVHMQRQGPSAHAEAKSQWTCKARSQCTCRGKFLMNC